VQVLVRPYDASHRRLLPLTKSSHATVPSVKGV